MEARKVLKYIGLDDEQATLFLEMNSTLGKIILAIHVQIESKKATLILEMDSTLGKIYFRYTRTRRQQNSRIDIVSGDELNIRQDHFSHTCTNRKQNSRIDIVSGR